MKMILPLLPSKEKELIKKLHLFDWETHHFITIPRIVFLLMAGRAFRGMLRTADYKDKRALKSCFTEFVHIHSAAFFLYIKKGMCLF